LRQTVSLESSQLKELTARMDAIITILALTLPKDLTQGDKIVLLSDAGFQPKEIANILGTTANTVSVTLSKMKREAKKMIPTSDSPSAASGR
jgi:DNA-binding CsgD family transcriptional regulator